MDNEVQQPPIVRWTLKLEEAAVLDRPVHSLEPYVHAIFGTGTRGAILRGQWLGHALHPTLTDLVLGTWTSATLLDVLGGREWAAPAQRLIGTGLLAAGPTAWTGWAEWSQAGPRDKRVGLVHAVTNGVAIGVYAASWLARRRGRHATGARLALLGATVSADRRLPGRPPHRGPQGRQPPPGLPQLCRRAPEASVRVTTDGGLARARHPPVRAPRAGHGGPWRSKVRMSRPCCCPFGNSSRTSQRQAATIARTSRRHSSSRT